MGCPDIYYTRALQYFSHCLAFAESIKLAKELAEETSNDKLESFILQKKEMVSEKEFYFNAGRTFQLVMDEAEQEGTDAMNASIGGLNDFAYFVGVEDEEGSDG